MKPKQASAPLLEAARTQPIEERVTLRTSLTAEKFEAYEQARAIVSRKHPGASVENVFNERPLPAPEVTEDQALAVIATAKRRIKLDLSG